ncbi:hypothetical protein [Micromonospora craterilacus]|uniref:hypothetical protein n=1 Tax=Micromonospora craterilacus TaxID=1655439 RepID=UPI001F2DCD52|nr:hypothetical protein [Micromonospora craterilacus]
MSVPRPANAVPVSRWATHPAAATAGTREDGTPRVTPGVYLLTREASPQFGKPITVRVIRERTDRHTYCGWAWIEVYQLDARGNATDRRELFVRPDGMRPVQTPQPTARRTPVRSRPARAAR